MDEALARFERICRGMAVSGAYSHPVLHLERRDTHISAVFLTGEWVYKLKKPVDFGFLDFTSLEARRRFCEQEVRLNRRLSSGVYDSVVEICRDERTGSIRVDGSGEIVEYAVRMRQLPEEASMSHLLGRGGVGEEDARSLGQRLADFYEQSGRGAEVEHYGDPEVIAYNMEENFRQVESFVGELVDKEKWELIRQVSRAFFDNWRALFEDRLREGRIRDGHGDLRAEHIYFFEGIQIIDCIEFNDRFRYGDVISDLAFLHMDMEHLGQAELSLAVLSAYVDRASDPKLYLLLDFYAAYRAVVKLKVSCLRTTELLDDAAEEMADLKERARGYLRQAYRYALQFSRPTLWVLCGLPATGKSELARRLASALSLSLFQSDVIRKEMEGRPLGHEEVVPYDEGIYRRDRRQRVYGRMLALAQDQLKGGHSVVLDASFSMLKWRSQARQLASDLDTSIIFIECAGSEASIRGRLARREVESGISDARLQHLPRMMRDFEPLDEADPDTYIQLDTDRPLEEAFSRALRESYSKRGAQVGSILV